MNRLRISIVVLLIAAACGAPAEVAPTTAAPSDDVTTTASTPATEAPTTTIAPTTTVSDEGEHDEGEHEDDGHEDDGHMGDARVVEVTMTEFAFEPESVTVSAGESVRFVVTNEGVIEHELRFSNEHRIEEHLASGHDDHGDEQGHHSEDGDVLVLVAAGETAELVVEFSDDTTIYTMMACLIPGHYEAGMLGAVEYA